MSSPTRTLILYALGLAVLRVLVAPGGPTSWDEAGGAFGLWDYDVLQHRPQPPGYPLWILAAQPFHWLAGEEHLALVSLSAVTSGLAALPMWHLARTCAPPGRPPVPFAWTVTALYTLNPVAWSFGSRALSGAMALALAPLLVLWLLRSRSGHRRALLWASALLGLAAGFRQELGLFLLPLWFVAWKVHRGVLPPLLVAVTTLVWAVPLVWSCGGLEQYQRSTDYMGAILRAESPLLGASVERAAATAHRVFAATVLAVGPLGLWGLLRLRRTPGWPTLAWSAVPTVLFCVLGYFHKAAYLFPALPALTVWAVGGCWSSPRWRVAVALQTTVWAGLYLVLPSAESVYRTADHPVAHESVGYPRRLLYPWLEGTWATVRDRDARREAVTGLLQTIADDQPDTLVWIEPGSRFSLRQAMWAAPRLAMVERPLADSAGPRVTLAHRGEWRWLAADDPQVQPARLLRHDDGSERPVVVITSTPPETAAGVLGGDWVVLQVAPHFQVLMRR